MQPPRFAPSSSTSLPVRNALSQLVASVEGVEGAAVMSTDGLLVAAALGPEVDRDRFAAMCASLLALAESAAEEINRGRLNQVILGGERGTMMVARIDDAYVLAVAAVPSVNLGRVFVAARNAGETIRELLQRG